MRADKYIPFLIIDDPEYLEWVKSLKRGDLVYYFNAHTLRLLHNEPQVILKASKTRVSAGNTEFERKNGLEVRDSRWCSWEGAMRIMPTPDYSLVENIVVDLEKLEIYPTNLEVELLLLATVKFTQSAPLRTWQLRKAVADLALNERRAILGYTGVCNESLIEKMMAFTQPELLELRRQFLYAD